MLEVNCFLLLFFLQLLMFKRSIGRPDKNWRFISGRKNTVCLNIHTKFFQLFPLYIRTLSDAMSASLMYVRGFPTGKQDFSIFDPPNIPVCSFHVCEALSSCIIHRSTFGVWKWEKWLFMHLCTAATLHKRGGRPEVGSESERENFGLFHRHQKETKGEINLIVVHPFYFHMIE